MSTSKPTCISAIQSDKAAVYVYRERRFVGSGGAPDIFINGEKVAGLPSGGYFIYYASQGEIVFSNQMAFGLFLNIWALVDRMLEAKKNAVLQLTVEAGKNYFVEWMCSLNGRAMSVPLVTQVLSAL